jgi:hypothetical protein
MKNQLRVTTEQQAWMALRTTPYAVVVRMDANGHHIKGFYETVSEAENTPCGSSRGIIKEIALSTDVFPLYELVDAETLMPLRFAAQRRQWIALNGKNISVNEFIDVLLDGYTGDYTSQATRIGGL